MNRLKKEWQYKELQELFLKNKMVLFCHYNSITMTEWIKIREKLSKSSINIKIVKNNLMYLIINEHDSANKFIDQKNVLTGPTVALYSNDLNINYKKLVKDLKSFKKLLILGGKVEDTGVSFKEYQKISNLPSIQQLQFNLIQTLNTHTTGLVRNLTHNQSQLKLMLTHKK